MKLTLWLNNFSENRKTEVIRGKTSLLAVKEELEVEGIDHILKQYEVPVPEVPTDLREEPDGISDGAETASSGAEPPSKPSLPYKKNISIDIGRFGKPDRQKPKNKAMSLCLLVNATGEVKRIPVETRERVYRQTGSLGISYGLIEDGELECIIENVFNGISVHDDEKLEFCYDATKSKPRYAKHVDERFRQFLESKLNKALNAYKAQLYIKAELQKIGLCEETATVCENGEKPHNVTLLRGIELPILNEGILRVVDGEYADDFVAIREESKEHSQSYLIIESELRKKLQNIYAIAAKKYGVKVPKIT